ncbi:ABC transporter ATP-binding protein (plasmid) [Pseudomonas sp. DTU_2021_1001937_2_SI_NGA_ILE_001]|uniref:ABC transporter ATP-binding protein n=1 Tax=Pseudomonas sp. DTU_2021_1001937_2_SI_NGA_ILE_001 TaxID=3077589 RepID=UPI0028FC14B4|nr:ABC transporter ATP-binding protein [Pseudomonas sp. DTU_2021_1001937_2_SI_NGA_ILE_001]WNW14378.1 ABC transporter ATP-binding protein [Pseudomonas sp. DTU_2021_1001937_2_SI_NGA_ILE_001]
MPGIELRNVSLTFPVISESGASLRRRLVRMSTGGALSSDHEHTVYVQALKDINLSIRDGDRIGLVGHNGSGKSTLLRLLAGIHTPTQGSLRIDGSTRALLELGVGIDHELSGRANIGRLARLYGYPLQQLPDAISDIEDFSGLGGYLDLPVRSYSSGMQLRLMFAVSTLYPTDILLIDEVLGVGDAAFQDKARQRMEQLMKQSKIVVLASHSPSLIQRFCTTTLRLEAGSIVDITSQGGPDDQVSHAEDHKNYSL